MPSQQHFYMEPQATLAVPGEDGCLTLHSATQSLDCVQQAVCTALGMPANQVNVGKSSALLFADLNRYKWGQIWAPKRCAAPRRAWTASSRLSALPWACLPTRSTSVSDSASACLLHRDITEPAWLPGAA